MATCDWRWPSATMRIGAVFRKLGISMLPVRDTCRHCAFDTSSQLRDNDGGWSGRQRDGLPARKGARWTKLLAVGPVVFNQADLMLLTRGLSIEARFRSVPHQSD